MTTYPALELTDISKTFPGVKALDGVSIQLHYGRIHALLGENGAGKSTLIKILTGAEQQDDGVLKVDGEPHVFPTPKQARGAGVTLVPQEVLVIPELSVGRNVLLGTDGRLARRGGLTRSERRISFDALRRVGLEIYPDTPIKALTVPELRMVQLAKALASSAKILILDEPTAVLSEPDADRLMSRLEDLRHDGKAICYVTHRLSEVMRLADSVTVLRDGRKVGHFGRDEIVREKIIDLMSKDGKVTSHHTRHDVVPAAGAVRLTAATLSSPRHFTNVDISLRAGEIVGVAGVQGSGHGRLLQAIAGLDHDLTGDIRIGGRYYPAWTIGTALKSGIVFVPADRRNRAIVARQSIAANIALPPRIRNWCRRYGMRWLSRENHMASDYIRQIDIRPARTGAYVGLLSGGNQQKVVLARALECQPSILLVEEPTQGIDIHAKAEIHDLIRETARRGNCAVVIASSEFEELLSLADTVHVMRSGRIVHTGIARQMNYRDILSHALS